MKSAILENAAVRRVAYFWTVEKYHRAAQAGALPDSVELIEGVVVEKMPKSPEHSTALSRFQAAFLARRTEGVLLRIEQPLTLPDSEPEPDLALVEGHIEDFATTHPSTAKLAVEVSRSTLDLDREKARMYGRAGVTEYWIANLTDEVLEVYTEPVAQGYRTRTFYRRGDRLPVRALGGAELELAEVL